MNIEDIKVGEEYVLPVVVKEIDDEGWVRVKIGKANNLCHYCPQIAAELCRVTKPKYDPNRKFRKGDRVDVILDGRGRTAFLYLEGDETPEDGHWVVTTNEDDSGRVNICYNGKRCARVWYNMLKLVTPVEELEPYFVEDGALSVMVNSRINERFVCCSFHKNVHPHAKEAAEAECARLNAEQKGEQLNNAEA